VTNELWAWGEKYEGSPVFKGRENLLGDAEDEEGRGSLKEIGRVYVLWWGWAGDHREV